MQLKILLHDFGFTYFLNQPKYDQMQLQMVIQCIYDQHIMLTCLCNVHPLTPHFYIVKLGFTGVYIIFLFLL